MIAHPNPTTERLYRRRRSSRTRESRKYRNFHIAATAFSIPTPRRRDSSSRVASRRGLLAEPSEFGQPQLDRIPVGAASNSTPLGKFVVVRDRGSSKIT